MFRVLLQSAAIAALSCFSVSAHAVEVYMFKGAGDFSFVNENMHFSRGLNEMSEQLNSEGIRSEVRRFGAMEEALRSIRQRKPRSIAIVGHSMGALASMAMARNLRADGIHIAYMALLDIPGPVGTAASNAAKVENYYTINPVYGKLTNVRTHPDAKNINILGYMHNRLDDAPRVQKGILSAIRQIHATEMEPIEPQPDTQYAGSQANEVTTLPSSEQQAYQPIEPQNAPLAQQQPNVQPYQLPNVNSQPLVDPVTTSSLGSSSAPVPRLGIGETYRAPSAGLNNPERRRYKRASQVGSDR